MKKAMFIFIVFVSILSFSSCKKEFKCDNGEVISSDDVRYQQIKNGHTVHSYVTGKNIHCY